MGKKSTPEDEGTPKKATKVHDRYWFGMLVLSMIIGAVQGLKKVLKEEREVEQNGEYFTDTAENIFLVFGTGMARKGECVSAKRNQDQYGPTLGCVYSFNPAWKKWEEKV